MEYLINELSLIGQCEDECEFIETILPDFMAVMQDIRNLDSTLHIFKKTNLYNSYVTSDLTLYNLIFSPNYRIYDKLTKFKSQLAGLVNNGPYWDENPRQDFNIVYERTDTHQRIKVSGSSVAEAYARCASLVSFKNSNYDVNIVSVTDGETNKEVINFHEEGEIIRHLHNTGQLCHDTYIRNAFQNKLNFDEISCRDGLNLITDDNLNLFEDAFKKFETLTWNQIMVDDALDYKEFHKNRNTRVFFTKEQWKKTIRKFRVNDKIRCFGYQLNNKFYVLRLDLEHRLSDLG